jgi:hypothetical protein
MRRKLQEAIMSTPDLPVGYSALEYVNIVKKFTHDSVITTNALDVELDIMHVFKKYEWTSHDIIASTSYDSTYGYPRVAYYLHNNFNNLLMVNNSANKEVFKQHPGNTINGKYGGKVPTSGNKRLQYHIHDCGYTVNGTFYPFEPTEILTGVNWGKMKIGSTASSAGNYYRIYRMTVRQNGVTTADLVPCTRESDSVPGLWCRVYNKFYAQN